MRPVTIGRRLGFMAGTKIIGFLGIQLDQLWTLATQAVVGSITQRPVVGLHANAQGNLLSVFNF